ncbi:MAG: aminotransferase class V-fold PLP-dependent enzyme [Candidatus Thiodiazotropha sp. (ex Ctena orbiculata)]|uniref:Aminotransferase class V-fold PLP-dependent enzyme n=1 Tax=Candidatus Thiodiazotropha taylori TaxID=2792791 RepID=A0A944QW04_9GAMM|nr:aminotransferase class V-fold PLP-dependent enzyme [Candidatus Thiodiazotropha taylori]MBT2998115.1 aminotransferase class V-fold PLP-dependent enzyme [Candidatus Thiodiazotropha taylori]MBT3002414.1 aminotransferase class V-fold PLP-dependent enzyme [Candidatus Thiodiazotropha taylori]MBT3026722.1 aminotransferase class V-fold PLP-dependent enzyme [Candidatus Thiodiazotropha taylori]MBT3034156.1 aminotransferase class V-fold PLP-dependent enzyme [Candidatus Thiodiazotropha taylori]
MIYLNHAAVAPWPQRTVAEVVRFAQENGFSGSARYPDWIRHESELRMLMAQLINAASIDDIALLKSTSEGLSVVAHGIDWRAGDNIVSIAQEFPSNRIVWESLKRDGVEVRLLDLDRSAEPEQDLIALCDPNTRLMSVSSVQYAAGYRLQLPVLGDYCRSHDTVFVVDAIQSLGAIPFDLAECHADVVVADGHKWMLGAEGVALFYCRPALRERLKLYQFGWHMVEHMGDYERTEWKPAQNARRFECGSPNMLGIHALHASLTLIHELGLKRITADVQRNAGFVIDQVDAAGFRLLTPKEATKRAGIVTFQVPDRESHVLYQGLMKNGVICAHRAGGIRFSPHFYNTEEEIASAFKRLKELL